MDNVLFYTIPFIKNLGVLYLTVFVLFLGVAIMKAGMASFSFAFWFAENKARFTIGAIFIFCLSLLMAVTDVSPLFHFFGLDINASPVGLGLSLAALLGGFSTKTAQTTKAGKAKEIQVKAGEIMKKSAEIVKDEETKIKEKKTK